MKKVITIITVMILSVNVCVNAEVYNGECGPTLTWTMNTESKELIISGSGKMDNWRVNPGAPWSAYARNIKKISLPEGLTRIGNCAFSYCTGLEEISIPQSVEVIGNLAFAGCWSLTQVSLPKNISSIGEATFIDCVSLVSIDLDSENRSYRTIDGVLFSLYEGVLWAIMQYPGGKTDTKYIMPSVFFIQTGAFYGNHQIESVILPKELNYIGDNAFYNCTSLSAINIPDNVEGIGDEAFYSCASIRSLTIPKAMRKIGTSIFTNCTGLESFILLPSDPPTGWENCDLNTNSVTLYVPQKSIELYKKAPYWMEFSKIQTTK